MSEYELLDLLNSYQQTQVAISMAFLTICSAFIVVIHFLGAKLNRYVILVLATLYSAYIVLPIGGILQATNRRIQLEAELQTLRGGEVESPELFLYNTIVFALIWITSLVYVWYVRRDV